LRGLFQAKRRNMERMAEEVEGADAQQLHHFNGNSPWRARPVYNQVAREASILLGGQPNSCLLLDETGFIKKGKHSVGAARQYIGRTGKVDNGQVAVFATLSNGTSHTLIDTRLYLPKEWTDDPARCKKAGVPQGEIVFRSKAQLALAMIRHARANGIRYKWLGMDGGYGKEPWLLRALEADGETFVADVHKDQRVYLIDPGLHIPDETPGRGPARLQAQAEPIRVEEWIAQRPKHAWRAVTLRDSTRGKLQVEVSHHRVWLWDGKEEMAHCWHLIVRREPGSPDTIKYSLSNAPAETPIPRLAFMQGARFWVERSFQDAKSECGMADYQVRRWDAWHHHMAMVMIAMLFMFKERLLQCQEMPLLSCNDIVYFLKHYLPRKACNKEELLEQIRIRHKKRQVAIDSAIKRQKKRLK
jgi:SRSO17 transposase